MRWRALRGAPLLKESLILIVEAADMVIPNTPITQMHSRDRHRVATFSGHRTPSAARIVKQFLADRPNYSQLLKNKILQAADLLLKVGK